MEDDLEKLISPKNNFLEPIGICRLQTIHQLPGPTWLSMKPNWSKGCTIYMTNSIQIILANGPSFVPSLLEEIKLKDFSHFCCAMVYARNSECKRLQSFGKSSKKHFQNFSFSSITKRNFLHRKQWPFGATIMSFSKAKLASFQATVTRRPNSLLEETTSTYYSTTSQMSSSSISVEASWVSMLSHFQEALASIGLSMESIWLRG